MPRPRGSYWVRDEIVFMLRFVRNSGMVHSLMRSRSIPNRPVYKDITRQLRGQGYKRTIEQVSSKFKIMRNNFYKVLELFGGCPPRNQAPPFFPLMRRLWILAGKPSWRNRHPSSLRASLPKPATQPEKTEQKKMSLSASAPRRSYVVESSSESDHDDDMKCMRERDTECAGPSRSLRSMKSTREKEGSVTHGFTTDQADDSRNIKNKKSYRNHSVDATPEMKIELGAEHDSSDSSDQEKLDDVPGTSSTPEHQYSVESDEESTKILDEMLNEDFSEFPDKIVYLHKAVVTAMKQQDAINTRFLNTVVELNKRISDLETVIESSGKTEENAY